MSRYADALRWLGMRSWFPRVFKPFFPQLDRWMYQRSGGRLTAAGPRLFPTLLLTTTGHRSRQRRTTPLFYVEEGDSIVVAATNFGLGEHPAWSENLLRNASAEVQIGDASRRVRARAAPRMRSRGPGRASSPSGPPTTATRNAAAARFASSSSIPLNRSWEPPPHEQRSACVQGVAWRRSCCP